MRGGQGQVLSVWEVQPASRDEAASAAASCHPRCRYHVTSGCHAPLLLLASSAPLITLTPAVGRDVAHDCLGHIMHQRHLHAAAAVDTTVTGQQRHHAHAVHVVCNCVADNRRWRHRWCGSRVGVVLGQVCCAWRAADSSPAMLSGCCTLHLTQPVRFVVCGMGGTATLLSEMPLLAVGGSAQSDRHRP